MAILSSDGDGASCIHITDTVSLHLQSLNPRMHGRATQSHFRPMLRGERWVPRCLRPPPIIPSHHDSLTFGAPFSTAILSLLPA